jgi:hypothetical protein
MMSLNKSNPLDTLIVVPPLPTLEDKGFTKNVLARHRRLKWQRYALYVIVWVSAGLSLLTVVPWRNFANEIDKLMTTLLNPLNQLQDVELLGDWVNSDMSQTIAESPVVLLTVLILIVFAGSVAGLASEE